MIEATKEKSLQRENLESPSMVETITPFAHLDESVKLALICASEKKAFDMVALDLREIASFTEFFIIVSGANQRQVQAISDEITEQLKKQLKTKAIRVEGYNSGEWILLDYGD
ncbi:MAG: ribosome silencing factor, partial [Acidobacteriota bacterium]|nr:ribosome silencing factor [Acidobacteriota bacterium]